MSTYAPVTDPSDKKKLDKPNPDNLLIDKNINEKLSKIEQSYIEEAVKKKTKINGS